MKLDSGFLHGATKDNKKRTTEEEKLFSLLRRVIKDYKVEIKNILWELLRWKIVFEIEMMPNNIIFERIYECNKSIKVCKIDSGKYPIKEFSFIFRYFNCAKENIFDVNKHKTFITKIVIYVGKFTINKKEKSTSHYEHKTITKLL